MPNPACARSLRRHRTTAWLLLPGLLALAACGGYRGPSYAGNGWDGRRGYDGSGDYGYDLEASRTEAREYRARASRRYPVPGTAADPWGPYVTEAASRFAVPERWIREVMRQESGGRLQAADGSLTTSTVGAMGLMQVMPSTYDMLRRRYGLGSDPYEPRNNILAGTAYIREMSDRFGAPAFLAAYNAGPDRLESYLAGNSVLPDETVNYLARVAPRLGNQVAMTGPLAVYAGGASGRVALASNAPRQVRAYGGQPYRGADLAPAAAEPAMEDPADRAYDGGGLVTASAPTGLLSGSGFAPVSVALDRPAVPVSVAAEPPRGPSNYAALGTAAPSAASMLVPVVARGTTPGGWAVQVGAYPDPAISRAAVTAAQGRAAGLLAGAQPLVTPVPQEAGLFRARLTGLSASNAVAACTALTRGGMPCLAVPPGS